MAELAAVGAVISLRRAYRASPLTVSWQPTVPGDCTELTAWAMRLLLDLGWPAKLFERWICKTNSGRKHALLIVRSGGKAKAIDCLVPGGLIDSEILNYRDWSRMPD